MLGVPGFASIGRFFEQQAVGAILGVSSGFMFDVGYRACLAIASQQLYDAVAVLAAKLCVVVDQSDGDRLHLPERLVTSPFFYAPALHFSFVDLFAFDCHFFPVPPTVLRSSLTVGLPTP